MAGCCHGIEYAGILHVKYEADSACALTTGVFPVQITETIIFFIIYFLLNLKRQKKGIVLKTLFFSALAKFLLEFLRYSHVGKIVTVNQMVCLIIMVVGVVFGFVNWRRRKINGSKN